MPPGSYFHLTDRTNSRLDYPRFFDKLATSRGRGPLFQIKERCSYGFPLEGQKRTLHKLIGTSAFGPKLDLATLSAECRLCQKQTIAQGGSKSAS
jgi:hypothetical protein